MNYQNYQIAVIGSHSALQILKGAKDLGFKTICVCEKKAEKVYKSFGLADKIIVIDSQEFGGDFKKVEQKLIAKNAILIPHGSLFKYLSVDEIKKMEVKYYGTKSILEWESDRNMERSWLKKAGLKLPKIFNSYKEIDRPVIVKFNGAGGGKDYFIARSPEEFEKTMVDYKDKTMGYVIQEYIVGVPFYCHYFYSPVSGELEIMGFDKRYESNADSIGRIAANDQLSAQIKTSYTITGNIPIVIRESLLPKVFEMGERVVEESKKLVDGGLFGPFCLEGIIDPNLNFFIFEISARIVAGTNPYINGSPYTWLKYGEDMSTGKRVALDIKNAIEIGKIDLVLN